MFDVVNDLIVRKQLNEKNYLIEYDNNNKCAIYFSSHGVYFPETKENFKRTILNKNYYEWYNTRIPGYHKHIFMRDITKQFYVEGISNELNSIDRIALFLKKETEGYKVTTVGSSAGGYVAVIIGLLLKVDKVFCYSGKFSLKDDFAYRTKQKLLVHENDINYSKYYNVSHLIAKNRSTPIYYVFPKDVQEDIVQKNIIVDAPNFILYPFSGKKHGVCMYPFNLPIFMAKEYGELLELASCLKGNVTKGISRIYFSNILIGKKRTLKNIVVLYYKKIVKRVFKKKTEIW